MSTLTYVYADSTAVLGPLASHAEPHCYDLCTVHADRLTVPRGWEVVRIAADLMHPPAPTHDDLLALADAVREAARVPPEVDLVPSGGREAGSMEIGRRGHLRVLRDPGGH